MADDRFRQFDPGTDSAIPYSMPTMSPLYGAPPNEYRNGWSQLVVFRSDPAIIARHVPKPLIVDPDGTMTMTISTFFASGFGAYHEAVLCASVMFPGRDANPRPANFTLYIMLDNDIPMGGGREIWGWPKKIGRVVQQNRDGLVLCSVERGGVELVRSTMEIGTFAPPSILAGGVTDFINLKIIPSVKHGARPEVMQLTLCETANFTPKDVFRGRATLSFASSALDDFGQFPVKEIVDAFYYNADFTLGAGEILIDYLK